MLKLALQALIDSMKSAFPEVENRIYKNWPGPEIKETYPYMVIFAPRISIERLEYRFLKKFDNGDSLYSTGYFSGDVDVNYLAREGQEDDQADQIDKLSDFFNVDFNLGQEKKTTEVSRDIPYKVRDYDTSANFRFLDVSTIQEGPDIKKGDRRSIFMLSMYAPRLKVVQPPEFKRYELDVVVSEKRLDT